MSAQRPDRLLVAALLSSDLSAPITAAPLRGTSIGV